jgi:hypothetical protein
VPVFSLAHLLGHSADVRVEWLVLCDSGTPLALAFAALDGYFQVPAAEIQEAGAISLADRRLAGAVRLGSGAATLINTTPLISDIKETQVPSKKE